MAESSGFGCTLSRWIMKMSQEAEAERENGGNDVSKPPAGLETEKGFQHGVSG